MDIQSLQTLVGSVGFPITMCLLIFWYMEKEQQNHSTETEALKEAINELKIAITTLTERITNLENKSDKD